MGHAFKSCVSATENTRFNELLLCCHFVGFTKNFVFLETLVTVVQPSILPNVRRPS